MSEELIQTIHETLNDNLVVYGEDKVIRSESLRKVSERISEQQKHYIIIINENPPTREDDHPGGSKYIVAF